MTAYAESGGSVYREADNGEQLTRDRSGEPEHAHA
jgi:hypothetical protein